MIELLAKLDKFTVQDGKEISLVLKCSFNDTNMAALVGIGIGAVVKVEDTQQQFVLDDGDIKVDAR